MKFDRDLMDLITTTPPVKLQALLDGMSTEDRRELEAALEGLAIIAAQYAAYAGERYGYGCGDQGHAKAVKCFNKAGHIVWRKVFGYNAYHNISF